MALTVSEKAGTKLLTSLAAVNAVLGFTTGDDGARDSLIDDLIARASRSISNFCGRELWRQSYTETFAGWGSTEVMLSQSPIAGTTTPTVTYQSESVASVIVENRDAGILYKEAGWVWTAIGAAGLLVDDRPVPSSERPDYSATYSAGYLLPGDNKKAKTFSAANTDSSFNDSDSGFPILVAGDEIVVSGFVNAANNGTFTVVSRTTAKIVVDATLTDEAAAPLVSINVRDLPEDIEQSCIETVKEWYLRRKKREGETRKVADFSISYKETERTVPLAAVSMLENGGYLRSISI